MTCDGLELVSFARTLAHLRWRQDGAHAYVKAGIMLDDLIAEDLRPRTLFEDGDDRRRRLMAAIDSINAKHGRWTVVPAVQGVQARLANAGCGPVARVDDADRGGAGRDGSLAVHG